MKQEDPSQNAPDRRQCKGHPCVLVLAERWQSCVQLLLDTFRIANNNLRQGSAIHDEGLEHLPSKILNLLAGCISIA